jgi:Flp pilus assembly protein TadD
MDDRSVCALLFAAAAALFAWRPEERRARLPWAALLALALANSLVIQLHEENLLGGNLVHYYLGAKYPVPYVDLYRAYQAALEEPQAGMRDLTHPARIVRASEPERREYFLGLLRGKRASFDPLAPTDTLERRARESGAIAAEADTILRRCLPAGRIEAFRRDVRAADSLLHGRPLVQDYGFNGSPFYAVARLADPALHLPLGRWTVALNLAWQLLAVALLAWLGGEALGLATADRLAAAALLLASWDFVGYAMSGLVFGELWLPVAIAALAFRRRAALPAGAALAWAGLVKLFPFALLVPLAARALRPLPAGAPAAGRDERRWLSSLLGACAVAVLVLMPVSLASGRDWKEFLLKIVVQFQSEATLSVNSVSLGALLACLGLPLRSPLVPALSVAAFAWLVTMVVMPAREDFATALPRRALVFLAATGWWTQNWFNYYGLVPLLLLPALAARGRRAGAALSALALGVSFVLPDFDSPALLQSPTLHALKLLPHVLVPAWLVACEGFGPLAALLRGRTARRVTTVLGVLVLLALAEEAWRGHEIARLGLDARAHLGAGEAAAALEALQAEDRLFALAPRDARARMNRGIALGMLGRLEDARASFAEAARLAPEDAAIRDNLARALFMLGRADEAGAQFEAALALSPADPSIHVALAQLWLRQGRRDEAVAELRRARELAPDDEELAKLLADVEAGKASPPAR